MEKSSMGSKPQEDVPNGGLLQISSVNAEPTWVQWTPINSGGLFRFANLGNPEYLNESTPVRSEHSSHTLEKLLGEPFDEKAEVPFPAENHQTGGSVVRFVKVEDDSAAWLQPQNDSQPLDSEDQELERILKQSIEEIDRQSQDRVSQLDTLFDTIYDETTTSYSGYEVDHNNDRNDSAVEYVERKQSDENKSSEDSSEIAIGVGGAENCVFDVADSASLQAENSSIQRGASLDVSKEISRHEGGPNLMDMQQNTVQCLESWQASFQQHYVTPHQPQPVQGNQYWAIPSQVISRQPTSTSAYANQIQRQLDQASSGITSNSGASAVVQPPPNTRQEQLWRSQPQGPYYRGTQNPKKVVRNTFLNQWLSMHRPDIPLPNSSGQGFLEQNQVFGNLSHMEQAAVNAFVVLKVEAEQAEARRNGLAKYREVDVKTGKGTTADFSTNGSRRSMLDSTNGMQLGRRIAPAPAGYHQQGANGRVHTKTTGAYSMIPSGDNSQNAMHPNFSHQSRSFGGACGYANKVPAVAQSSSSCTGHYVQVAVSHNHTLPFAQCGTPVDNSAAPVGTIFVSSNAYNTNWLPCPLPSQQQYAVDLIQHGQNLSKYGYLVTAPQTVYKNSPYMYQQPGGQPSTQNLGFQSTLSIGNDYSETTGHGGPSLGEGLPDQNAEMSMVMHEDSAGMKRQQSISDDGEDGSGEGGCYPSSPPSKRARRI